MRNKVLKESYVLIFLTLACLAFGIWMYPQLPDRAPTHWNIRGEVDGWSGKTFAVFFFPVLSLAMYAMFNLLPSMDPNKAKYQQFAGAYAMVRAFLVLFMDAVYVLSLVAARGYPVNTDTFVRLGISLLFIGLGDQMGRVKQNWFVGIRTPWTLSSEENWRKTHRFGARTMVIAGILSLILVPFKGAAAVASFVLIIAGAMIPMAYSYVLFRKGI